MFDRRVQVLKDCESIRVFPAEGHCHSLESSRRGLGGSGHRDSGRVFLVVGGCRDFGEVVEEGHVAEGQRRVCGSRTW